MMIFFCKLIGCIPKRQFMRHIYCHRTSQTKWGKYINICCFIAIIHYDDFVFVNFGASQRSMLKFYQISSMLLLRQRVWGLPEEWYVVHWFIIMSIRNLAIVNSNKKNVAISFNTLDAYFWNNLHRVLWKATDSIGKSLGERIL